MYKKLLHYQIFFSISFIFLYSTSLSAEKIYINVGTAKIKKSLLALPPALYYGSSKTRKNLSYGQKIYEVIYNDLAVSSLFQFIGQDAYLEDATKIGLKPAPGSPNGFNFSKWSAIGTEFLVRMGYQVKGSTLQLEAYLYYVPKSKLVFAKNYSGPNTEIRKLAHRFAGDIYTKLTGRRSFFETKLVVASNRANRRHKEIFVMDWDSANPIQITAHRSISISPAWSPDGKKIAYSSIIYHRKNKRRNTDLFIYDLQTRKRWLVSYQKGINSGAAFFPNGKKMLLTLSLEKNPDIFTINTDGKNLQRLTKGPNNALNVEPAPSPDGREIAFSSTRGGRPAIYLMNRQGRNVRRLTAVQHRYNASPAWSPDGQKIAFAGYDKDHFDLFIMNKNGSNLKRLTQARKKNGRWSNNEDPSFSPDGRHIMFVSDRTGTRQIYIVDIDGSNERRITFDKHNYERPKWSPYLN